MCIEASEYLSVSIQVHDDVELLSRFHIPLKRELQCDQLFSYEDILIIGIWLWHISKVERQTRQWLEKLNDAAQKVRIGNMTIKIITLVIQSAW